MGNSCIGMLNHKFFILYLFYLVYWCSQIAGPFFKIIFFPGEDPKIKGGLLTVLAETPNEFIVYALASCLMMGIGFMLVYQIVILLMNKTTMEVSMDTKRHPFKHKSITRNIEMVFGTRKCQWFSPFHSPFPDMKLVGFTPS